MNLREDCSVKDSWLISQIRLDDGFRNLLGFEVLLGDVCKVMLLKVTLTEHSVVGLLINRGEPHHVFTVQISANEPPYHLVPVSEKLSHNLEL